MGPVIVHTVLPPSPVIFVDRAAPQAKMASIEDVMRIAPIPFNYCL